MNYMTFSLLPIHVHVQLPNNRGQSSSVRMQDSSPEMRRDILFYFILHQKAGISFPSLTESHRYVIHINHCIFLHKKCPARDFN